VGRVWACIPASLKLHNHRIAALFVEPFVLPSFGRSRYLCGREYHVLSFDGCANDFNCNKEESWCNVPESNAQTAEPCSKSNLKSTSSAPLNLQVLYIENRFE
jgi:hypothetical protein